MKVATTRASLHKIQHKSIQVVAEGSGLENHLIRNFGALRNLHTMFVREKLKHFADSRIGSSRAYKRTMVAGKELLNFEDLQESCNHLFK